MAAAAEDTSSASNVHSARQRQNDRELASPWSRVVRGGPELTPATDRALSPVAAAGRIGAPEELVDRSPPRSVDPDGFPLAGPPDTSIIPPSLSPSDGGDNGASSNASREKKSPWSAPSNGLSELEPVMGAVSWPALSEASKNITKPSSSESQKALSDGSAPTHPAPPAASSPRKASANNTNSYISATHTRQKTKRVGGSGSGSVIPSNGRPMPLSPIAVEASASQGKPVSAEPSPREFGNRSGGLSPQLQGGSEHHRNHGGTRRGNVAGGGPPHSFGNRRDQDRSSYDWNQRSFGGGRDVHGQHRQQPRGMARPFIQPPPLVSPPFIAPPRVTPIGYHEIPSPVFYIPTSPHETMRGIPFVPPPAMYFAAPDPHLQMMLAKQIDYYFSPENLCRDTYLRQNMDEDGWVHISLIANFNRVKILTNNIQFILDTMRTSSIVEVQGDKIRRRDDWMNWPPLSPASDSLAPLMRNMGLEDGASTPNSQTISPRMLNPGSPEDRNSTSNSTSEVDGPETY